MTTPAENKEIVQRTSFDLFTEGDMDVIEELVSEDYVLHDPDWPEEVRGRDGLKTYAETLREAMSDLSFEYDHMAAEGDLVAVHFTCSGTNEGPIPELGIEPTGNEFTVTGMEFDRIEDGKLAETWVVFDTIGLMEQLGMTPEGATSTEHRQSA
ncbi:ester cyclase [Haloprofundus halobius]|uniref:ester cyclase n=1 Tax=Haloprofundus halobius TaxID=2876194 RepID=UPI001CCC5AD3|nr:ester cyclase [Haloprofundus halobius]